MKDWPPYLSGRSVQVFTSPRLDVNMSICPIHGRGPGLRKCHWMSLSALICHHSKSEGRYFTLQVHRSRSMSNKKNQTMKATLLLIWDFDIPSGDVTTNKGIYSNRQWERLMHKIGEMKKDPCCFCDVREVKRGWVFYTMDPTIYMH